MKTRRILSTILAMIMIMGLVVVVPSVIEPQKVSAATNYAAGATYRGSDNNIANGTSDTGQYGEANWNTYHSGRLNDGTIASTYTNSTTGQNVEMYISDFVGGTVYVYFKLAKTINVTSVDVFANDRDSSSTNRGYPSAMKVYVGTSETSYTSLGTSSYTSYNTSVRKYNTSGFGTGNYVIIEMTIASAEPVIALTEVQIYGFEGDVSNVAGRSTYRGSDNNIANGTSDTGQYGEANWNTYHSGRLNDGTIASTYTNSTTGQNVEMYISDFVGGTVYVYFKLPQKMTVVKVDAFANDRDSSSTNRGYPSAYKVYVGDSESARTSLGTASYSAYNTSVRDYKTTGSVEGTYVILEMTIAASEPVIALTEVQIYAYTEGPSNVAGQSTYRGSDNNTANGTSDTGQYGEANWNTYHSGRLNDGTIASSYTNSTTGQNVEMYISDFVGGTVYVYFQLPSVMEVSQVNVYANDRDSSSTNRGYPSAVNIYVGTSESASASLGTVSSSSYNTSVKKYTASGSATGNYVVISMTIAAAEPVIALTEVEIIAATPSTPTLTPPTLTGSTGRATYTVPTITWNAVTGATAYDVYLNGTKVVSDTTTRSYTPSGLSTYNVYGSGSNRTCESVTVVAKGSGYVDSAKSAAFEFLYVPKPIDRNGNELTTADFVLDAGHGGSDPGALSADGTREEANDTLNMTMAVGKLLEEAGFTVAYTRTVDRFDSIYAKAAMVEAGSFRAFLCFHRNSFNNTAKGVEYYYYASGNANSQALATAFNTEFVSDAIWTNRGVKTASYVVLKNTTLPACLLELGFIDNDAENVLYDTYFNETAQAVARGAIKFLGHTVGYTGYVDAPASVAVSGSAASASATVGNYGSTASFDIRGWMLHSYGVEKMEYSVNGGSWTALSLSDRSSELSGYSNYPNKSNSGFSTTISTDGWAAGTYTVKVRGTSIWDTTTKYTETFDVATITLNVEDTTPSEYTVTFKDWDGYVIDTQTVTEGQSATAPNDPTRTGYTFSGWDVSFTNITSDTVVTATYTINSYTVSFVVDGEVISEQSVTYGSAAVEPDIGTKEGYTFSGWDKTFDNVTSSITVSGSWNINSYTVYFAAGEHGTLDGTIELTVVYGTEYSSITYPIPVADAGYKFDAWSVTEGKVTGDTTITASFVYDASQWFTVTYVIPENGTSTDALSFGPFVTGTAWSDAGITAPTVTCQGLYSFKGWDKTAPDYITENLTFTAIIELEGSATVTYVSGEGGVIVHQDADGIKVGSYSVSVDAGTIGSALELPIVLANDGYVFDGWYANGTLYDFDSVIDDSITLTAVFKANPVSITNATVATESGYAIVTLTIAADSADFASRLYVFNQHSNGMTTISTNAVSASLVSDGIYQISFDVVISDIHGVDVYLSTDAINFAADDWQVVAIKADIAL